MEFKKIDLELAKNAYRGVSFEPEERGERASKDFDLTVQNTYKELLALCTTDNQKSIFNSEFERFQSGYKDKYESWLSAMSRVVSVMITGGSNFPTRRNERANNTVRKRAEEMDRYYDKVVSALKRKINLSMDQKQRDDQAVKQENEDMKDIMNDAAYLISGIVNPCGFDSRLLKEALVRKMIRLLGHNPELLEKTTNEINDLAVKNIKRPLFTKRHYIYRAIKQRFELKEKADEAPKEDKNIFKSEGYEIFYCPGDERVRFFFDEKPNEDIRNIMKNNAFKWSPKIGAWQRKNTSNGISAMKRASKQILEYKRWQKKDIKDCHVNI